MIGCCGMSNARILQIVVSCTKGILNDSLETVNQVLERVLPEPLHGRLAFLSGPSFAAEVHLLLKRWGSIAAHATVQEPSF